MAYNRRNTRGRSGYRSRGRRSYPRKSRGGSSRTVRRRVTRAKRRKPDEIRIVVETVPANPVSRNDAILRKLNPPSKKAKL